MITDLLIKKRKELGYSQKNVAELAGIERSYYTKIENGLTPSVKTAKAISNCLGLEWTLFFTENSA